MTRAARIMCVMLAAVLWGAAAGRAPALPMAPEECVQARTEQAGLNSAGTAEDLAKGPEWARANLSPDRLRRVARWIELEEQLLFRCPRPKPPPAPATAARTDEVGKAAAGDGAAKPARKPKKAAQEAAGDTDRPSAKVVKPKPPAKKKVIDDAYLPPVPYSGNEVQHVAPGLSLPAPPAAAGLVPGP